MWRVLPPLLLVAGLVVIGLTVYLVVTRAERERRRSERIDRLEAELREFQQGLSMDDIRRHRDRLNQRIDEQFDGGRQGSGNPLDL